MAPEKSHFCVKSKYFMNISVKYPKWEFSGANQNTGLVRVPRTPRTSPRTCVRHGIQTAAAVRCLSSAPPISSQNSCPSRNRNPTGASRAANKYRSCLNPLAVLAFITGRRAEVETRAPFTANQLNSCVHAAENSRSPGRVPSLTGQGERTKPPRRGESFSRAPLC